MFPDALGVSPLACSQSVAHHPHQQPAGRSTARRPRPLADLGITHALKVGNYATLPGRGHGSRPISPAPTATTPTATWPTGRRPTRGLSFGHTGLATGDKFPDALAAGPYLSLDGGILLLSPLTGPLPSVMGAAVTDNRADVHHVTYIAMIEPVVGQVKALLP